ncbi:MAG: UDP-N-acetylmuramate dehydrogenase [Chloroherpetonaceae bacterium]|nr:UDP-N-acetylmuramate dehydrogenase [Chloroherpetonaceae bacterium]MDW8437636.1 UDP-N-acetylmuramate dehydrogenase [Chloroherpetonaceae bacterium]
MLNLEELRQAVRGEAQLNYNLAKFSSFRIGGNADIFIAPKDKDDVLNAVRFFEKLRLPYVVLGRGSNVLVSDKGVRGAVISLRENLERVEIKDCGDEARVYVEAGADLPALAVETLKKGYGGLENLSGIPGSVGGAILMNAGAYGKEIFELIEWVEVIRNGEVKILKRDEIAYRYRGTDLQNDVILSCELRLKKLSPEEQAKAMENRKAWMEKRRNTQPLSLPNAGSIFKNPPPDENGNPRYAGALIEACGLKGRRIGGAEISDKHANFIVNAQNATARDVLALIELARTEVKKKFGVQLELEIKLLGEFD